jgi:hypothetical protein
VQGTATHGQASPTLSVRHHGLRSVWLLSTPASSFRGRRRQHVLVLTAASTDSLPVRLRCAWRSSNGGRLDMCWLDRTARRALHRIPGYWPKTRTIDTSMLMPVAASHACYIWCARANCHCPLPQWFVLGCGLFAARDSLPIPALGGRSPGKWMVGVHIHAGDGQCGALLPRVLDCCLLALRRAECCCAA